MNSRPGPGRTSNDDEQHFDGVQMAARSQRTNCILMGFLFVQTPVERPPNPSAVDYQTLVDRAAYRAKMHSIAHTDTRTGDHQHGAPLIVTPIALCVAKSLKNTRHSRRVLAQVDLHYSRYKIHAMHRRR